MGTQGPTSGIHYSEYSTQLLVKLHIKQLLYAALRARKMTIDDAYTRPSIVPGASIAVTPLLPD